ncbi:MAG: hypothetical protein LC772_07295, partial [Chloroflexi bacterium]|nr:hypothetical protein [Chloroflexota bacterium]
LEKPSNRVLSVPVASGVLQQAVECDPAASSRYGILRGSSRLQSLPDFDVIAALRSGAEGSQRVLLVGRVV